MDQKATEEGSKDQDRDTASVQDERTEYRVYEHPLLPKRVVKIGFCWPALLIGPAYLIYRKLWVRFVISIVAIGIARFLAIQFTEICDYLGQNCHRPIDESQLDLLSLGALIAWQVMLGLITNWDWEKDLQKRGYVLTKSVRARSADDALAILEREKVLTS